MSKKQQSRFHAGIDTIQVSIVNLKDFAFRLTDNTVTTGPTEAFCLARFSIPFDIDSENPPLPAFSTPLLGRRYAIDVTLSFPDTLGPDLKVALPLEIVRECGDPTR